MADPIEIVTVFCTEVGKGKDAMQAAFRRYFREDRRP